MLASPASAEILVLEFQSSPGAIAPADDITYVRPVVCLKASTPATATADGFELIPQQ